MYISTEGVIDYQLSKNVNNLEPFIIQNEPITNNYKI